MDYYRGRRATRVSRIDEPDNMPEILLKKREQYQKNRQKWPHEEDMPSPRLPVPCDCGGQQGPMISS
ncbi:MAG: hypothetical protein ACLVKA_11445 [Collinsella aerofaciens]